MPSPLERLDQARRVQQAGDLRHAETLLRALLKETESYPAAWALLGNVLQGQGRHEEAIQGLGKAATLAPQEVHHQLALARALEGLGRLSEALPCFIRAVRLQPADAEVRVALGVALAGRHRLAEALEHLQQAVALAPQLATGHHNLGVCLAQQGRSEEAAASLERALQLQPDYPEAHYNLGNVLRDRGQRDRAIIHLRRAIELRPLYGEAYNNLGLALIESNQPEEAVLLLQQGVRLRPQAKEAINNLGLAYADLGRFDQAEHCYWDALRLDPAYADAHANLGNTYKEQGRTNEALACYQLALALEPRSASSRYNRALALLQAGDYTHGWPEYEWRWKRKSQLPRLMPKPQWDGSALAGKTIFLWCEQGLGDAIMFARFAAQVKQRGGTVIQECPGHLLPLLSGLPGADQIVPEGRPLPHFDVHCPLLSLPGLLGTTLDTVPTPLPYLQAQPARIERWAGRLPADPALRIGVVWQGNRRMAWDHFRSFPLACLEPVAKIKGVHLISLQKGYGAEQLPRIQSRFAVQDLGPDLDAEGGAFLDTAAIMSQLDLVITADTSAAHLAGALGVPVWLALSAVCDWRWLYTREDTPWYPTMRLFRQKQVGDWAAVFTRMAEELQERISARSIGSALPVAISPGELIDRLTILTVKSERITDPDKQARIRGELESLRQLHQQRLPANDDLTRLQAELYQVNNAIWEVEDALRLCERNQEFGDPFTSLARSVYQNNDRRSALKHQINALLGSPLDELKSYTTYG
jgi:tetratricopeptide (TPR) repeat protein